MACHNLLVTRVVHDELPGAELERGMLEDQVVRVPARLVVILLDTDDPWARSARTIDRVTAATSS